MRKVVKWLLLGLPLWAYGWIGLIEVPDEASRWYQLITSIKPYTAQGLMAWSLIFTGVGSTLWFGWLHDTLRRAGAPSFAIEPRSATLSEKSWARIGVKNLTRKMLPKCTVRVSSWELPVFAELDTETRSLVDDSMHQHFAPRRLPWMDNEAEEFDLPADGSFYYVNVAFLEYGGNRCILAKGGQGWTGELGFEITISSPDENARTLRKKLTATCDPGKRDLSGISTISTIAMYPIVLQEVGDAPIKRLTQRILSLPPSKAP
jgi:hypothetical protein